MKKFRLPLALALIGPLALALAACGSEAEEQQSLAGEPIAAVPAPEGQQWANVVAVTPEGGYLVGNAEAPIKVVEYGSLTCPACAAFSVEGMQPLLQNYVDTGRVSFEFRSVPIHGAVDLVLTRLLECGPKEAAVPLADQIWANLNSVIEPIQTNPAAIEQAMTLPEDQRFVAYGEASGLYDFFAARGLSTEQARQCLSDFPAIQALGEKIQNQATEDGVNATPTFFVNGQKVDAARWNELEPILQNAGAR